jgi:hypothetical protein
MHPSNNVNNTPDIPRTDVYTLDKNGALLDIQKNLVRELVKRLNNFDNIIFEICNEPYFGGVTIEWQHAIADVIAATEKDLPKKHLISQNIQNGASVVSAPHPSVSVYNWHYAYPPTVVGMNYHLRKPIGDNETGFRGVSDSTYRFEGWRFIMAGGALFNHLDYSFAVGHENGDHKYDTTQPGGGSKALRRQLSYLKKYIERFDFLKMKPDSSLVETAVTYNCISEKGKQYAIYFSGSLEKQIRISVPTGKYRATWVHPLTGKEQSTIVEAKNDRLMLTVPRYKEDLALGLKKIT